MTAGEQVMKLILAGPVFMQCASTGGCYIQVRTARTARTLSLEVLPLTHINFKFSLICVFFFLYIVMCRWQVHIQHIVGGTMELLTGP